MTLAAIPGGAEVGILGAGFIARHHVRSWAALGVPIHLYSRGERHPDLDGQRVRWHPSAEALIEAVSLVDICLPSDLHAEYVLAALRHGRDVVCEKPLALTKADLTAILETMEISGRRLFIGHVVRYFPEYVAVREQLLSGALGHPWLLRLSRETYAPAQPQSWLRDPSRSGGIVLDLMIHDLDYARWLLGDVVRVCAEASRLGEHDFDDHVVAILTHASGALSHVVASWGLEKPEFRTAIELAGSLGLAIHDSQTSAVVSVAAGEADAADTVGLPPIHTPVSDDPFTLELADILRVHQVGGYTRVDVGDAIAAVELALAVRQSLEIGHPVTLERTAQWLANA